MSDTEERERLIYRLVPAHRIAAREAWLNGLPHWLRYQEAYKAACEADRAEREARVLYAGMPLEQLRKLVRRTA